MLSNSSSTQPREIRRYSYPHVVDSLRDLEGKGSLNPFSNTDRETQVLRAGSTKETESAPDIPLSPRLPQTIPSQHARAEGKEDPALGPPSCSLQR